MKLLRTLVHRIRRRPGNRKAGQRSNQRFARPPGSARGNQRAAVRASRAILGSLSLGTSQKREPTRLWRVLLWPVLALVLFQMESGILAHVGLVGRVDVAVLFVAFFALHLGAIEGALAAYLVGYVADLFVQGPPGLCRFLAVATWTVIRIGSARVSLPTWFSSLVLGAAASALYQAGVLGGLTLVAAEGSAPGTNAWLSVVPQALLTGAVALPIHALLLRLDRLTTRGEPAR